jgi:hypothetical protein
MIAIPAGVNTELVARYVAEKAECDFVPGMYQAMAILDDQGTFCAGVVFHEYRGHDVQISCATDTSAAWRPSVMKAVFSYVFNELGCVRCTSFTKKSNKPCRSFLEGLGFVLEGRIRLGHDGVKDALIYGLLAKECVYIQDDNSAIEPTPLPLSNGAALLAETPDLGETALDFW